MPESGSDSRLITGRRRLLSREEAERCTPPWKVIGPSINVYEMVYTLNGGRQFVEYSYEGPKRWREPADLWMWVHSLLDCSLVAEGDEGEHLYEGYRLDGVTEDEIEEIREHTARVIAWVGPELWKVAHAALQAADGSDYFERFCQEITAETWEQ